MTQYCQSSASMVLLILMKLIYSFPFIVPVVFNISYSPLYGLFFQQLLFSPLIFILIPFIIFQQTPYLFTNLYRFARGEINTEIFPCTLLPSGHEIC